MKEKKKEIAFRWETIARFFDKIHVQLSRRSKGDHWNGRS